MGEVIRDACGIVSWCAELRPLAGMLECGDRCTVAPFADGVTIALIDGLGHGHEAALASRVIAQAVERHAAENPEAVIARCHEDARSTRGGVMAVAQLDARTDTLSWAGVGNVEGILLRAGLSASTSRDALVARGGIVGPKLPRVQATTMPIARGDVLVFTTDGIKGGYASALSPHVAVDAIVDTVVARFAKDTDDVGVLVARYEGGFATDVVLPMREDSDAVMVRNRVRGVAASIGVASTRIEALATATTEAARNALVHGKGGSVAIARIEKEGRQGVIVVVRDAGPGIDDVERAMHDGFTTIGTLGLGLPSARRLVDNFEIVSTPRRGTTIVIKQWAP
jgi:negative regulator of sigma-B (phosphoserine phosphatase)